MVKKQYQLIAGKQCAPDRKPCKTCFTVNELRTIAKAYNDSLTHRIGGSMSSAEDKIIFNQN